MNSNHATLCPSPQWAAHIQGDVLPSLAALTTLGAEMLELGPGPGAATEWLRHRVRRLVALEANEPAAAALAVRVAASNVEVVMGDATALRFPEASFDTVGCFTMLHHLPSSASQQRLIAEAHRVLRPGGAFIGSDSLASNDLHHFHEGDDYLPVDPGALFIRLQAAGFSRLTITVDDDLRFVAHKPDASIPPGCPDDDRSDR